MAKVKLTKNALKAERDSLKRYQRYLPTLLLKKQQLQMEMRTLQAKVMAKREEEDALRPLGREIVLPRVVDRLLEMRPVVESRPGDGLVVELEAERTHQVQLHAESDAEPSNRPRVVRNLGTEEHDGKFFSHVNLS